MLARDNMLVNYTSTYQKIAMGLLSFVPELKEIDHLTEQMNWYESQESQKLLLWKDEDTDNFIGLIGLEVNDKNILIRHLVISPSFRGEKLVFELLNQLEAQYPDSVFTGTIETSLILAKWNQEKLKENERE